MITSSPGTSQAPTRERLLREGLALFAKQGFAATSVGEIEAAAGLQPRRGALYRHFPSKEALLEAAVAAHFDAVQQVNLELFQARDTDPKTVALVFGRWLLADLDAQENMTRILEREGDRLTHLRDRFRAGAEAGFLAVRSILDGWLRDRGSTLDAAAMAATLMGGIVNFRRSAWTLGAAPLELDDDRFLTGFADMVASLVGPGGALR
jgi:AcrR family transcriptional regulator